MSKFDLTKDELIGCLPDLDLLAELVGKQEDQTRNQVSWAYAFSTGDYLEQVAVHIKLCVGRGVHSQTLESGYLSMPASYFMKQDNESRGIGNMLEQIKELANNIEYRQRAIYQARALFK